MNLQLSSSESKDGGGFKVNFRGDGLIQFHPTGRHHCSIPYYKVSNAELGIKRHDLNGELLDG